MEGWRHRTDILYATSRERSRGMPPIRLTPVSEDEGGKGWAGVYWQYPRQLGGGQ